MVPFGHARVDQSRAGFAKRLGDHLPSTSFVGFPNMEVRWRHSSTAAHGCAQCPESSAGSEGRGCSGLPSTTQRSQKPTMWRTKRNSSGTWRIFERPRTRGS